MKSWEAQWDEAARLAKERQWPAVVELLERCSRERPDFGKGYVPLSRALRQLDQLDGAVAVLRRGLENCASSGSAAPILGELRRLEGDPRPASETTSAAASDAAAEAAALAAAPAPTTTPSIQRQSSLPSVAAQSLLDAGFEREGWAWWHEGSGTRVIESDDGGTPPEVYNPQLAQADIDARVSLTFELGAWGDGFGRRLLRWIQDALVQDGATAEEVGIDADEGEDEDARAVDVGLSRLPTAEALGATRGRKLTVYTWGDKVVSQKHLEDETGCTRHFNAKPLNGRGGGANLKLNATQDNRVVRNVASSMLEGEGQLWLRRVVAEIERADLGKVSVFCSQGRHRSVSAALVLCQRYYPGAELVAVKMR